MCCEKELLLMNIIIIPVQNQLPDSAYAAMIMLPMLMWQATSRLVESREREMCVRKKGNIHRATRRKNEINYFVLSTDSLHIFN